MLRRLGKSAYLPSDKVSVDVGIKNDSAVDVTGFSVSVSVNFSL